MPTTTPRKKAKKKVTRRTAPLGAEWRFIDVDDAIALLEQNTKNRKLYDRHVSKLAKMMKKGAWLPEASDTIKIGRDGSIHDGQHRLWAVVESQVGQYFLIVDHCPADTRYVCDALQRTRKLKDAFTIDEEGAPAALAATVRLCQLHVQGQLYMRGSMVDEPTTQESRKFLKAHAEIRESVREWSGKRWSIIYNGAACFLHWAFTKKDAELADQFMLMLYRGIEISAGSAMESLRRQLEQNRQKVEGKISLQRKLALCIKAWNCHRSGQHPKVLRVLADERPEIL